MKKRFTNLLLLFFLFTATTIQAQFTCNYTLQLIDSFGDGWNGSNLAVTINGITTNYTLDNVTDDGLFNQFLISVTDGDDVSLNYSPGTFEGEVSYFLFDSENLLVFSDGPNPQTGDVFSFTGACPSCPVPSAADIFLDDVRAFYADISWVPSDPNGDYSIEFGLDGFTQGMGQTIDATGFDTRLEPLEENTEYDFYMTVFCENGDTSNTVGPISFQTLWANDVGIVDFSAPQSGCGLGIENIMISMQNFGGLPQTLIPFNFSVNDIDGGVPMPQDGFFTGVLGKDSIVDIEFETTFDFSEPGEYIVKVWTDLESDSLRANDTLEFVILSIPQVDELPYSEDFEEWNGGWIVGEDSQNSSWAYGSPAGALINEAASGFYAWVSNLSGEYNNNELSYIESPCFDFSDLTEDPRLSFSIFFESEACCDEAWVESSIDGGQTWTKVGTAGTGGNWYNDTFSQWWDGDGDFDGWVKAFNTLSGTAGEAEVRVRFVLSTDGSVTREGIGIDDILIAIPFENDLEGVDLDLANSVGCGPDEGNLDFTIFNAGTADQTGFDVAYSINGGAPVIENVGNLNIAGSTQGVYSFSTPFATGSDTLFIQAWSLIDDENVVNDTAFYVFIPIPIIDEFPYIEDLEENNGGWRLGNESVSASWQYGVPAGTLINMAASGENAWVTNLSGDYNDSEFSYLESPCLDFSDFTEDPRLSFSLFFESESCCDEAWVESSTDGGETWTKVGVAGTGANWYNDEGNQWWDGTGNFTGWVEAFNNLAGTAGSDNVKIRFVFSSDGSVTREGMGVDDISILIPAEDDLAGASVSNGGNTDCGTSNDVVQLTISNTGLEPKTGFDVAYSINNGTPVVENVGTLSIEPGEQAVYAFQTTFSSLIPGPIEITAWIATPDELALNDTTTFSLEPMLLPLPLSEDFESGAFPMGWTSDEGIPLFPPNDHNNDSWIISDNNYSGDQLFTLELPAYGPLDATSTLSFEYRYTVWAEGTEPIVTIAEDILRVEISRDCGFSFDTIFVQTGDQHVPTADFTLIELSLEDYLGESIILRFTNNWGAGDYWFDMDNININSCAAFDIDADVVGETVLGAADGSITLVPQGGNFTYEWNTGDTGTSITDLVAGQYSVTVTDEQGCSNIFNYTIDVLTGVEEISSLDYLNLFPNPTNGTSTLDIRFNEVVDVHVQVFNVLGQEVASWQNEKVIEKQYQLSLSDKASGVYLVKITANGESHTMKLIKGNR
jgi:hypothetical protein